MHAIDHRPPTIRKAWIAEIDTLCRLDLDSTALFERAGLRLDLPSDHEFSQAERNRWLRCLAARTTLLAVDQAGVPVGFAATGVLDGEPYLDQLSVRMASMQRGIGRALLNATIRMVRESGGRALWLTTYCHLSWNRPCYERHGFVVVPAEQHGREMAEELAYQRRWLPLPEERVVMRRDLDA